MLYEGDLEDPIAVTWVPLSSGSRLAGSALSGMQFSLGHQKAAHSLGFYAPSI